MLDDCFVVGGKCQRRDSLLRTFLERTVEAGNTLTRRPTRNLKPERFFAFRLDREHVPVRHGEKTEARIGDLHAFDDLSELIQRHVGSDHAGDILAVFRPQRMEEAHDEFAGNRVDVRGCRSDVIAFYRARIRLPDPAFPALIDAGKEEIPEIRVVVARIELVEGLRLIRNRASCA